MQNCEFCQIPFQGNGTLCPDCLEASTGSKGLEKDQKASQSSEDDARTWWQHVLIRDGMEPLLMEQGRSFRFGRHESNDIRISSRKASRHHAQIDWSGSQATLIDLDSNNGSFVNDKKITNQPLKDGDELRIATLICTYRKVHSFAELDEEDHDSGALTTAGLNSMYSGHLHKTPLIEVMTAISHDGDTGVISVLPKKGQIGFRQGEPVWAYARGLEGEPALLALVTLESGMFVFTPKLEDRPININRSFAQIVSNAIDKRGPSPTTPPPGMIRRPKHLPPARRRPTKTTIAENAPPPRRGPTRPIRSTGPRRKTTTTAPPSRPTTRPSTPKGPIPKASGVIRRPPPRQAGMGPRPKPPPPSTLGSRNIRSRRSAGPPSPPPPREKRD